MTHSNRVAMDAKRIARFWAKVEKTDGCWLWRASVDSFGYGSFNTGSGSKPAHRVSFIIAHGREPSDCVLHSCDVPGCVNPDHLFEGTRTDNHIDKMNKGRGTMPPTHWGSKHPQAKLHESQIPAIRALIRSGQSYAAVARRFGVSKKTIVNIWKGRIWAHVA